MTRRFQHPGLYALIAIFVLWSILPIALMMLTSVKPAEVAARPTDLTFRPTLESYRAVFEKTPFLEYLGNTVVVASATTLLSIVFGSLAAYSFARFRFPGHEALPLFYLIVRMVPRIVLVVPYFMLLNRFGLLNTYQGLFLSYTTFALPFVIWMMLGFFKEIPVELEEAGLVDGCNRIRVLRDVVIPLVAPGLVATAIFTFLLGWNEFLFALILSGSDSRTLPMIVASFETERGVEWGPMSAASIMIILPIILFALGMQRYLIRGLTAGAVKA